MATFEHAREIVDGSSFRKDKLDGNDYLGGEIFFFSPTQLGLKKARFAGGRLAIHLSDCFTYAIITANIPLTKEDSGSNLTVPLERIAEISIVDILFRKLKNPDGLHWQEEMDRLALQGKLTVEDVLRLLPHAPRHQRRDPRQNVPRHQLEAGAAAGGDVGETAAF